MGHLNPEIGTSTLLITSAPRVRCIAPSPSVAIAAVLCQHRGRQESFRTLRLDSPMAFVSLPPRARRLTGVFPGCIGSLALLATIALPTAANQPSALEQLLETNACVECNLRDADLRRLDLSGANLRGADLSGANFFQTKLDGADLARADLTHANFWGASLRGTFLNAADFSDANLSYADFTGASLYGALFEDTYIEKTIFVEALLSAADMREVQLVSADFTDAILCGAELHYGDYRSGCTSLSESTPPE